jgi:hypothetical protein
MGHFESTRFYVASVHPCRFLTLFILLLAAVFQSGCIGSGSLVVSPTNVDFGKVPVGASVTQDLTITNSGSEPFEITNAEAVGNEFGVKTPVLPLTLSAGERVTLKATFTPTGAGDASGSLLIIRSQPTTLLFQSGLVTAKRSLAPQQATITLSGKGSRSTPTITAQPSSQTVASGQAATFLVAAAGKGRLRYQWRKNGRPIRGATSKSYTAPVATVSDSGSRFAVVVANSAGRITSNAAVLTVDGMTVGQATDSTSALNLSRVNIGSSRSAAGVTLPDAAN